MDSLDKIQVMHDTMTKKPDHAELFEVATSQHGYFTAVQARSAGIGWDLLSYHTKTGRFVRDQRGIYRFRDFPPYWREEVVAAWLAVGKDIAVVSHESALDLLELSDVIPNSIHLTVPRSKRYIRARWDTTIHTTVEPIPSKDVVRRDGLPITSPTRTIFDAAEIGVGGEQVEMAIRQALHRGITTPNLLCAGAERQSKRVADLVLGEVERYAT